METPRPVPPQEANYYHELELLMEADMGAIKRAYRRMARLHRPDKLPAGSSDAKIKLVCVPLHVIEREADEFQQVQQAYEIPGDASRRKSYDASPTTQVFV